MLAALRTVPALATALLVAAGSPACQEHAAFRWHDDLDEARQLAHEQHKPLFVLFRCER